MALSQPTFATISWKFTTSLHKTWVSAKSFSIWAWVVHKILMAKPGPGNGCLDVNSLGRPSSKPKRLTWKKQNKLNKCHLQIEMSNYGEVWISECFLVQSTFTMKQWRCSRRGRCSCPIKSLPHLCETLWVVQQLGFELWVSWRVPCHCDESWWRLLSLKPNRKRSRSNLASTFPGRAWLLLGSSWDPQQPH